MVDPARAALIVVDMQPDFMPGGALGVAEGDRILGPVCELMASGPFVVQVATQDWHPPGHVSFASSHPGRRTMESIELYGHQQILWPDHCVQGTAGAALHADLPTERLVAIVRKATQLDVDSYSAFRNNWNRRGERPPTGLAGLLRERGVEQVFLCGLARDFCVQWSAEDALEAGFEVKVLWDLTRSVAPASDAAVRENLLDRGADLLHGEQFRW